MDYKMKTQKINQWTILESEEDVAMLREANKHLCSADYKSWHVNFWDLIDKAYLPPDCEQRVAIDIGCSYGWLTIPFAKGFKHVHSFDAHTDVISCIKENLATCNIDNVTVHDTGLSMAKGKVPFKKGSVSGTSRFDYEDSNCLATVTTLDSFNFTDVDLIKLDVEGHEYNALLGSLETIKNNLPLIILECHSIASRDQVEFFNRQEILHLLFGIGYRIIDIRKHDIVLSAKEDKVKPMLVRHGRAFFTN